MGIVEVKNIFLNIYGKKKNIFENIWGVDLSIYEKTSAQKSDASVPLLRQEGNFKNFTMSIVLIIIKIFIHTIMIIENDYEFDDFM